ncbi:MAG: PilN domain-containing protein [Actinomycetota bacterium]|nr:PilN domain-containing protein [Actinomycetota bacterium]
MSTMTVIPAVTAVVPRVNLLPPEFAERRRVRRLQTGLGAGVAACAVLVGGLYVSATHEVDRAQQELDTARAETTTLTQEVGAYAHVPVVFAKAKAGNALVAEAMATEIRWSDHLSRIANEIPQDVWFTQVTVAQDVAAPTAAAPTAATPTAPAGPAGPAGATTSPMLGTVTVAGTAMDYLAVSTWLEKLAGHEGFTKAYFHSATEDESLKSSAGKPVVNFNTTAGIIDAALAPRRTQEGR